jgi:molecular chaperone GrpE (heat shock protein)
MHGELEQLRRGERRSLLRPVVTEVCRLRDDLLRQADTLPADFDQKRAADLLRSYADSLEFTLDDNGITTFAPEAGEAFQARLHKVASKVPTRDGALVGTIAAVVSPGYRDVEADAVIAGARVVVYVADASAPEPVQAVVPDADDPAAGEPERTSPPTSASADEADESPG